MKEFTYREAAEPIEQKGIVVKRDLALHVGEHVYLLSVATPQFIDNLREVNEKLEEDLQGDDNILPMESVSDLNAVIDKINELHWEDVEPYLVKQNPVNT